MRSPLVVGEGKTEQRKVCFAVTSRIPLKIRRRLDTKCQVSFCAVGSRKEFPALDIGLGTTAASPPQTQRTCLVCCRDAHWFRPPSGGRQRWDLIHRAHHGLLGDQRARGQANTVAFPRSFAKDTTGLRPGWKYCAQIGGEICRLESAPATEASAILFLNEKTELSAELKETVVAVLDAGSQVCIDTIFTRRRDVHGEEEVLLQTEVRVRLSAQLVDSVAMPLQVRPHQSCQ